MKDNKFLEIVPPKGYEVDEEKSTFKKIVFKPIIKKWRDNPKNQINGGCFVSTTTSNIIKTSSPFLNIPSNYNIFAAESQAKSAIAMARISQIMANDERFGGVVADEEWETYDYKYTIGYDCKAKLYYTNPIVSTKTFLAFHTPPQAELFIEENEDLLNDYFMI